MQHSVLVLVLLSLAGVGCEQSQPAPPALPALAVPLPGPPQPLLLPQRIDEKLEFIGPDGKQVREIVCKTRATIQYRYRLPPDWTEAPDRAMCNEQTSQIAFQLIMMHKGQPIISGQGRGVPTKTASGEYILTTTVKVPPTPGKGEYFLRAQVYQRGRDLPRLTLDEIPIKVLAAPVPPIPESKFR